MDARTVLLLTSLREAAQGASLFEEYISSMVSNTSQITKCDNLTHEVSMVVRIAVAAFVARRVT